MVQPGPGGFSQTDMEELDDEQIIGCPSHSTREVIIFQSDGGVGFVVVFGDIARCSKTSWKLSVVHGASEYLGTRPFEIEVASLTIIAAPATWVPHAWLGLCTVIPWVMPRYVWGSDRALNRTGRSQVEKPSGDEVVAASGAPWVAFRLPSLGLAGGWNRGLDLIQ
jgi:hypothetical protein